LRSLDELDPGRILDTFEQYASSLYGAAETRSWRSDGYRMPDEEKVRSARIDLQDLHEAYLRDDTCPHDVFFGGRVGEVVAALDIIYEHVRRMIDRGIEEANPSVGVSKLILRSFIANPRKYLCWDRHEETYESESDETESKVA
jgi:hypothetical protein